MNQEMIQNKRIAVAGLGGVGGYMGALLGKAFPHVTFAARGKRLESIRQKGLVLHSDFHGEIVTVPEKAVSLSELEEQDYIFVCVKNYSLEEVCREMAHAVTEHTVLIPVMNGVDPGARMRKFLEKGTVVDSLIYIIAFANDDYSVTQQGGFANLCIGIQNGNEEEFKKVQEVAAILSAAGIHYTVSQDIESEIWRKYILNCAYNVATACYDNTIGQLRDDPEKAKEYEDLVYEAYGVALAKGVHITQEHIDGIIRRFYYETAYDATSSLQRDLRSGKTSELETFSGYIVREGHRLGVSVPVSERMYESMLDWIQNFKKS